MKFLFLGGLILLMNHSAFGEQRPENAKRIEEDAALDKFTPAPEVIEQARQMKESKRALDAVEALLRALRAELPEGWTALYRKESAWLEIFRDEKVLATSQAPNLSLLEIPERHEFALGFRVTPAISPAEHRRMRVENASVQTKADKLAAALRRGVVHKFDSFSPQTDEDKASVAQYEKLKKSLHRLPEFYFGDIGLSCAYDSQIQVYVEDEDIRKECAEVHARVLGLLSSY